MQMNHKIRQKDDILNWNCIKYLKRDTNESQNKTKQGHPELDLPPMSIQRCTAPDEHCH